MVNVNHVNNNSRLSLLCQVHNTDYRALTQSPSKASFSAAMQQFVGQSPWAWEPVWERLARRMVKELEPDAV